MLVSSTALGMNQVGAIPIYLNPIERGLASIDAEEYQQLCITKANPPNTIQHLSKAKMAEVHIVAIFSPKPGKVDRLKELLAAQVADVHAKEDYCLRFIISEQINEETPDFVLFETYKSEESTNQHVKEPHFLEMFNTLGAEDLLSKRPYVAKTITTGGFDLDMRLM